jgi:hypothetical protein
MKIIGKGIISLGNKDVVAENVLLVENMKHNLVSVRQMCDQGNKLIFNSKESEIRIMQTSGNNDKESKQHIHLE